jgi:phosphoribosylformylglycinamidine (FGAM) synthase-like enzyme
MVCLCTCESARYVVHVDPENVAGVLKAIRSKYNSAEVIGEVTDDDKEVFEYNGKVIATIPNKPSKEMLEELRSGK